MSVYDELSNIADVVKTDIDDQAKVVSKIDDKIAEAIALLEKIELSEDVEAIEIDIQAVVKMLEKVRSELY
jgi:ParB-like chromosome segregation protein Spo0J